MPREKIAAKYTAQDGSHYMGIPARDIGEEEFDRMSDEQKALLAESPFYNLRHDAPAAAEKAVKRVEKAEPVVPMVEAAKAEMPAPKDEAKK
jgi:hypothetical protein